MTLWAGMKAAVNIIHKNSKHCFVLALFRDVLFFFQAEDESE